MQAFFFFFFWHGVVRKKVGPHVVSHPLASEVAVSRSAQTFWFINTLLPHRITHSIASIIIACPQKNKIQSHYYQYRFPKEKQRNDEPAISKITSSELSFWAAQYSRLFVIDVFMDGIGWSSGLFSIWCRDQKMVGGWNTHPWSRLLLRPRGAIGLCCIQFRVGSDFFAVLILCSLSAPSFYQVLN